MSAADPGAPGKTRANARLDDYSQAFLDVLRILNLKHKAAFLSYFYSNTKNIFQLRSSLNQTLTEVSCIGNTVGIYRRYARGYVYRTENTLLI